MYVLLFSGYNFLDLLLQGFWTLKMKFQKSISPYATEIIPTLYS